MGHVRSLNDSHVKYGCNASSPSLVYTTDIKNRLLDYINTALHFSDRKVDPNLIAFNRVVLLHGPPGTGKLGVSYPFQLESFLIQLKYDIGKTSLCKALANKAAIRFSHR